MNTEPMGFEQFNELAQLVNQLPEETDDNGNYQYKEHFQRVYTPKPRSSCE
ncbi:hypothetical protein I7Z51_002553 [Vibrio parahaemolyticus]|uniref:hypothetical protein n=1 Tax=Vibrio TaxID=662 RepID=UPI001A8EC282|nr:MULTISPECIES: hypothetical protein [Vibrio]EGQ7973628.1 hypothetical protein [Vibrio parahaemolyticus]MBO0209836.1 hypothetical protein [Vibrio sp. Vb0877]MCR9811899.1 hypothetical protein [Vibrio parahaemolyticus]MDW2320242.1 hypothetical protein [Vibrio sp. 1159]